jgi:hypothetical protein
MISIATRLSLLPCLLVCATLAGAELTVGPGKAFALPSQAAAAAVDGDTISIDAGTYSGDVCTWTRNNLTIRGVGGFAHLAAAGASAGGKAIWVIQGANTTVENIEFSDAAVPSWNGAGIRQEGAGLTVRGCWFHDNEEGILAGDNATSDILIERTEFGNNGHGDGFSHNLYINHVRSLTFRENYSHHAKIGHNLKTRALTNYIIGNRLMDEATGTSSYVVDVPDGGLTYLIGNLIQQGPLAQNSTIVTYGEEGGANPSQHLYVTNNTIVNDRAGGTFLFLAASTTLARVEDNIFLGTGTAISGTATSNLHNLITATDPLVNRALYDYHLVVGSAAIDAGADPGLAEGYNLLPVRQYVHPRNGETRATVGAGPDIGAYEFGNVGGGGSGGGGGAGGGAGSGGSGKGRGCGWGSSTILLSGAFLFFFLGQRR